MATPIADDQCLMRTGETAVIELTEGELSSMLDELDYYRQGGERSAKGFENHPDPTGEDHFNPDIAMRISRPAWIAFIQLCVLLRPAKRYDLAGLSWLGSSVFMEPRMTRGEVDYLSRMIQTVFGSAGVVVTIPDTNCPHPGLPASSGTRRPELPIQAIPDVPVAIEVVYPRHDVTSGWMMASFYLWPHQDPVTCLSSALTEISPASITAYPEPAHRGPNLSNPRLAYPTPSWTRPGY